VRGREQTEKEKCKSIFLFTSLMCLNCSQNDKYMIIDEEFTKISPFRVHWSEYKKKLKKNLPDRVSNPGLPRDRREYLPLYYRGIHENLIALQRNPVMIYFDFQKAAKM
jgi:hypothetical protein